jgi:hypothetical protein
MANTKIPASAINTAAMGTLTVTANAMAMSVEPLNLQQPYFLMLAALTR